MSDLAHNPAFGIYAVTAALLCLNLMGLWLYSGLTRNGTRTLMNAEDSALLKGRSVVERDPPDVARVLRAHANAMANVLPFLILGFLYVLLGAGRSGALAYFRVFPSSEGQWDVEPLTDATHGAALQRRVPWYRRVRRCRSKSRRFTPNVES